MSESKKIRNDFSWSKSRHEKFAECRRAYFFHYYQSWGGWEDTAPPLQRELYTLKKLSNRYTWGGSLVHEAIKGALTHWQLGRPVDGVRQVERVHALMRDDFAQSRAKAYRKRRIRKEFNGLVEHEYAEAVANEEWLRNWLNVKTGIEWFYASRWPGLAQHLKTAQWLEVDVMDFEKSIFFIDDVKIFAVPDFAFRGDDGSVEIVDWKTGAAREGYDDQVLGYALYLNSRYQIPVTDMRATLVYVNAGVEKSFQVEKAAIAQFVQRFNQSSGAMKALLHDVPTNAPLAESSFLKTEDRTACARCPFRRPCGRETKA